MSDAFMDDEWCTKLLRYCMDNLKKHYKLILLDKSEKWKQSDLGFRSSSEVRKEKSLSILIYIVCCLFEYQ